jgi:hypothetical protein
VWLEERFTMTGETIIAGPFSEVIMDWPDAIAGEDNKPCFPLKGWKASTPVGEFARGTARTTGRRLMSGIAIQTQKAAPR